MRHHFNTLQQKAVQYSTVQYSTVQYSTTQYTAYGSEQAVDQEVHHKIDLSYERSASCTVHMVRAIFI